MKVVFFGYPAHGHTNPTLPLITMLVKAGVEVIYYSNEEFMDRIKATGAVYRDYETPILKVDYRIGNLIYLLEQITSAPFPVIEKHLPVIEKDNPDLIIYDCVAVWGKIIAEKLRTRTVSSFTLMRIDDNQFMEYNLEQVKTGWPFVRNLLTGGPGIFRIFRNIFRLTDEYDIKINGVPDLVSNTGELNILYTSKEFHPPSRAIDRSFIFVGPSIGTRPEQPDFDPTFLDHPGLIYISLGTIFFDRLDFYRNCIKAFGDDERYRVILSIGDGMDPSLLKNVPSNFLVRRRVPQLEILKHAKLFITHGGMNSVHEALHYKVPMVVIPQALDQFMVANHLRRRKLAIVVKRRLPSVATLRQAANKVLEDPAYRENFQSMETGLDSDDGYKDAVRSIMGML